MSQFTQDNWNYCQYIHQDKKALISLGASPDILDTKFLYMVTVLDSENNELFQEEFDSANAACQSINNKYSEFWEFVDMSAPKDTDGCSSCEAH